LAINRHFLSVACNGSQALVTDYWNRALIDADHFKCAVLHAIIQRKTDMALHLLNLEAQKQVNLLSDEQVRLAYGLAAKGSLCRVLQRLYPRIPEKSRPRILLNALYTSISLQNLAAVNTLLDLHKFDPTSLAKAIGYAGHRETMRTEILRWAENHQVQLPPSCVPTAALPALQGNMIVAVPKTRLPPRAIPTAE
jgi:hypothetical protein